MPTVLLLSTSDTDLITARASAAQYLWANPARLVDGELARLLNDADVAVVRLLLEAAPAAAMTADASGRTPLQVAVAAGHTSAALPIFSWPSRLG